MGIEEVALIYKLIIIIVLFVIGIRECLTHFLLSPEVSLNAMRLNISLMRDLNLFPYRFSISVAERFVVR
jgi:NADH:ubiquinone oxidoreductase subunit K